MGTWKLIKLCSKIFQNIFFCSFSWQRDMLNFASFVSCRCSFCLYISVCHILCIFLSACLCWLVYASLCLFVDVCWWLVDGFVLIHPLTSFPPQEARRPVPAPYSPRARQGWTGRVVRAPARCGRRGRAWLGRASTSRGKSSTARCSVYAATASWSRVGRRAVYTWISMLIYFICIS